jgi:shikimate dehydrogenase
MIRLGLIGKKLSHSFSQSYFQELFRVKGISGQYDLIEIDHISLFEKLRDKGYRGFNVTIPYKEEIIPYLDELDDLALAIGAVNTILVDAKGKTRGYNTDIIGLESSIKDWMPLSQSGNQALILGSGGAGKSVAELMKKYKIPSFFAQRSENGYVDIEDFIATCPLIFQCSPLGMYPQIESYPPLPYSLLGPQHYLFDMIYNPEKTIFIQEGIKAGAKTKNGLEMLYAQAGAAWKIWGIEDESNQNNI